MGFQAGDSIPMNCPDCGSGLRVSGHRNTEDDGSDTVWRYVVSDECDVIGAERNTDLQALVAFLDGHRWRDCSRDSIQLSMF